MTKDLDPYTSKAENNSLSPDTKIAGEDGQYFSVPQWTVLFTRFYAVHRSEKDHRQGRDGDVDDERCFRVLALEGDEAMQA